MKRSLAVVLTIACLVTSVATAKSEYKPQRVTYTPTYNPYVEPRLGDGSTPSGGVPPAFSGEPANIQSNFDVRQWMVRRYYPTSSRGGEAKFRTHCNYSHHRADDPIVGPGKPGASHLHTFYGNTLANAGSTYETLRTQGGSTCGGGPINRSAYWHPAVLKDIARGDGKTMIVKPDHAVVYYNALVRDIAKITRFPRGFSYVFGFNPADPKNMKIAAEVAAANKKGSGTIYASYRAAGNGFGGWRCETANGSIAASPIPGSALQPYLMTAAGKATLNCPVNERIGAVIASPQCWDGVNLSSPDGRNHVRYMIKENNTALGVCPIGWYRILTFQFVVWFSHKGMDDYKNWYLSSDRMPGRRQFLNGQSFHADWFGAWDYHIMSIWMRNCNGLTFDGKPSRPHSCIDTQFGDGKAGIVQSAAPDQSRFPQIDLVTRWAKAGKDRFDPLP